MFPDEASARTWFERVRWPDGNRPCPRCGHAETQVVKSGQPMPYRCPQCRQYFSAGLKVGTVMESSKLPLRKWVIALPDHELEGREQHELHRELRTAC